jgi:hypothetical protein
VIDPDKVLQRMRDTVDQARPAIAAGVTVLAGAAAIAVEKLGELADKVKGDDNGRN